MPASLLGTVLHQLTDSPLLMIRPGSSTLSQKFYACVSDPEVFKGVTGELEEPEVLNIPEGCPLG